MFMFKRQNKVE